MQLLTATRITGAFDPVPSRRFIAGHMFEFYGEFTRQAKTFPDPKSFRIKLPDLADLLVRQRLAAVWTDPISLDPGRKSAKVTGELAKPLEKPGHDPASVAQFLTRCLFTMFAADEDNLDHLASHAAPFCFCGGLLRELL